MTTLPMIVAEELDVDSAKVILVEMGPHDNVKLGPIHRGQQFHQDVLETFT